MKTRTLLILAASTGILGCATVPPTELVQARRDYQRASTGPASDAAPAEVHIARDALVKAENSFEKDGDTFRTRDLAYVAARKSAMAEATAAIDNQRAKGARSAQDYEDTQGDIIADKDADLNSTRSALASSQRGGQRTAEELAEEKVARKAADERAAEALAALAKLAAVKAEPRGTVITLSGSVLFASNKSTLLSAARSRLEQVADVLLEDGGRKIIVEGHTDSQGSDAHNLALSQRRADAVRQGLVNRGYDGSLIQARGMGEGTPVADNANTEGRANNRRVELIIEKK